MSDLEDMTPRQMADRIRELEGQLAGKGGEPTAAEDASYMAELNAATSSDQVVAVAARHGRLGGVDGTGLWPSELPYA